MTAACLIEDAGDKSEHCCEPQTISLFVNLALKVVLPICAGEVKALRIPKDFDCGSSRKAGKAIEGPHVIAFSDGKEL